jgi:DNA-3-methyladenine glycosylase II
VIHIVDSRLDLIDLPGMEDEEIISQLTSVKGVGRWTADMFLIFCLARKDILHFTDLGLRNVMERTYLFAELPTPKRMIEIANPYRSIATWYLWKSSSNFNAIG